MPMRSLVPLSGLLGLLVACGGDAFVADDGSGGAGGSSSSSSSSGSTSSSSSSSGSQTVCDQSSECRLTSETCCGVCGMPTLADMVALHEDDVSAHVNEVCADPVSCPDCPVQPNPNLFAYCDAGVCKGVDITNDPLGGCLSPSDCKLRLGLECCECGYDGGLLTAIPIAYEQKLQALVCEPDFGCPECAPVYPMGAEPWCEEGHCVVIYMDAPSDS